MDAFLAVEEITASLDAITGRRNHFGRCRPEHVLIEAILDLVPAMWKALAWRDGRSAAFYTREVNEKIDACYAGALNIIAELRRTLVDIVPSIQHGQITDEEARWLAGLFGSVFLHRHDPQYLADLRKKVAMEALN
ncbi:MAG: hypothetical protein GY778_17525 [bacterium]|nr:hypothetical protein [bacterium]